MRIGLVGCVKSKRAHEAAARDLYVSPLFRGARCYVERSCDSWFILSAEHGLLGPDEVVAPYERTLSTASVSSRRGWAARVLEQVDSQLGSDLREFAFELHAGAAYLSFGLNDGLAQRGAELRTPLAGLRHGERLRFYKVAGCL
jgi:hypothetical protein